MLETNRPIEKTSARKRGALLWFRDLLITAAVLLLIGAFVLQPVRVKGESMRNTLQNGELMIVTKYDYLLGDPDRFDVVICHFPEEGSTVFVKRIVGIPGDTVRIANGTLLINGDAVDEGYIEYPPNYAMPEKVVGPGNYFVLGDNRASSMDSHIVGLLDREHIIGHVRQVIWPLDAVRTIE